MNHVPRVSSVRRLLASCLLLGCLPLAGCFLWGSQSLYLSVEPPVNQGENGQNRPVHVKIYCLSSITGFEACTLQELWDDNGQKIAKDVVDTPRLLTCRANSSHEITAEQLKVPSGASYVGVVAQFAEVWDKYKGQEPVREKAWVECSELSSWCFVISGYRIEKKPR